MLAASIAAIGIATAAAWAGETVIYQYDELGRLKSATQTGTVNNNVTTQLQYDAAGNRTNYSVAGSNGSGSGGGAGGGVGQGPGGAPPPPPPPGPPPPPSFSIDDVSATEGSALVFTVTKTGAAVASFSVNYGTADGTALAGSDYTAASGTLTFLAAETTKTVSISSIDNSVTEVAESMFVNLSGPTGGGTITDPQGSGTINDNDVSNNPPTPVNDSGSVQRCGTGDFNVTLNDTDPDADYPLTVASVTGLGFSVLSSTTIRYINNNTLGTKVGTYTVQDSRGATATATLTITVTGICE